MTTYPIPQQAANAWSKQRKSNRAGQNPGLLFERYVPAWQDTAATSKREGLKEVQQAAKDIDTKLLAAAKSRWERAAELVQATPFRLTTSWRLIAGLGRKGALEVGFTFHRYGFPYLPGSSLKGVARAAALQDVASQLRKPLKDAEALLSEPETQKFEEDLAALVDGDTTAQIAARVFRTIFGTIGQSGRAIFLDALPDKEPVLDLDIMNPHYPNYYQSDSPPHDCQNPRPVLFLAVAPETTFCFAVGWRGPAAPELQEQAKQWLVRGLTDLGVGAKTSAGYGFFQPPTGAPDATPRPPTRGTTQPIT